MSMLAEALVPQVNSYTEKNSFEIKTLINTPIARPKNQAFNLGYELANYQHELGIARGSNDLQIAEIAEQKVHDAFKLQLEMFIGEYLSSKAEFQYQYYFNDQGKLQSEGWSTPAEENYFNAIGEVGPDAFTQQVRVAESLSFQKIQAVMIDAKNGRKIGKMCPYKAILQSPAENYPGSPYSFVSFYELQEVKDPGTGKVSYMVNVRNRKIFAAPDTPITNKTTVPQHMHARDAWLSRFANSSEPAQIIESITDIENTEPYNPGLNLLSSIIVLPESANFDELLTEYNQPESIMQDLKIRQKLEKFAPEITSFLNLLSRKEAVDTELESAFKALLVKAKVHFDEDEAKSRWGEEVVWQIQAGTNLLGQGFNLIDQIDQTALYNYIEALPITIAGSCGSVDFSTTTNIGNVDTRGLTNALSTFSMPWEDATYHQFLRPNAVICSCGCKWYVKNEDTSTYKDYCPNPLCHKPQRCSFSKN